MKEASNSAAAALNSSSIIGENSNDSRVQINYTDTQTSDPNDRSIVIKISFHIDLDSNPEFINTNETESGKKENKNHPVTVKISTFLHLLYKYHPSISFWTSRLISHAMESSFGKMVITNLITTSVSI